MERTFIWEPLSNWESIFDKNGKSNEFIDIYDELKKEYIKTTTTKSTHET